ncbi:unnamed protein product [Symbiodinium natans]|uniref:Inosine/uridine-preferring nucleoside hydrolase domain-containing protein n=1 Tax=Symbiodinium natans TaxID=878477 RepID=A0A812RFQ5_9DINO|nr:unnamed protein product [Symbiodinium natans]
MLAFWVLLLAGAAAQRPVIISTDPGIDDSIALLLALASPELDVRAVCINFGSLHNTSQLAQNALDILALAGREDIPVFLGATDPISQPFHDLGGPKFHGTDGLGGVRLPHSRATVNTSVSAVEFIVHACRSWQPAPLLVSLAPLTNVALALNLDPKLPERCPDLFLMGGTVAAPGNVGPMSEANIANDPEAAARVLSAGFNTQVAALDVTMASWLPPKFLASLRDLPNDAGPFIWQSTRFYERAYETIGGFEGGMPLHDPTTLLLYLKPELYQLHRWPVTVDTSQYPSVSRGILVVDRRGGPKSPPPPDTDKVHFPMQVDVAGVQEFLLSRLRALPAGRLQILSE